jgi:serine O-acetyltransferase
MLKLVRFSRADLLRYVVWQLEHFFPDGKNADAINILRPYMDVALDRLAHCIGAIRSWKQDEFDHLHSSQYTTFLYYLSNTIWKATGNDSLCAKLFGLNKALNGIDLFYEIEMPPVFFIGHSVGIVFANATYGNYLVVYQNSTVGKNHGIAPVLGEGVIMYPNTAIIGCCEVGDGTVLSQGVSLINAHTPGHCTVYAGQAGTVVCKPTSRNILVDIFREKQS